MSGVGIQGVGGYCRRGGRERAVHGRDCAERADVFFESNSAHPQRRIASVHRLLRNGDLYLRYGSATFAGTVDLKAKSSTSTDLQDPVKDGGMPWYGDKDGADTMVVERGCMDLAGRRH